LNIKVLFDGESIRQDKYRGKEKSKVKSSVQDKEGRAPFVENGLVRLDL
jgi:hypothetical protein